MKRASLKLFFISAAILLLSLTLFQNCGPAKLSSDTSTSLPSLAGSGIDATPVGTKVDLKSLLSSAQENPSNILYPPPLTNQQEYAQGTSIIENIVLLTNDFSKIIWVYGPSSTVVAVGDAFNQGSFSPDLLGLYYVFGYRGSTPYLIDQFKIVSKGTTSLNVNSTNAIQINQSVVASDAQNQWILIEVKAPFVDFSSIQFILKNSGTSIKNKRAILVQKLLSESFNVEVDLADISGQSSSTQITLAAGPVATPNPNPTPTPPPAPVANFSTTSVNFGSQPMATTSATLFVTLTNIGNASLDTSQAWSVSAGDFSFSNAGTCGSSLAPATSCLISLKFVPTAIGLRTGTLTVITNAANSPQLITLSGNGLVPSPVSSLSTTALSFATQTVSTKSGSQTVTITNSGSTALIFANFSITGVDFSLSSSLFGNCKLNQAYGPGANCTVLVVFNPTAAGARAGTLNIQSNATVPLQTVSLTGSGL